MHRNETDFPSGRTTWLFTVVRSRRYRDDGDERLFKGRRGARPTAREAESEDATPTDVVFVGVQVVCLWYLTLRVERCFEIVGAFLAMGVWEIGLSETPVVVELR